jgi:hypothetical protein
LFFAGKKSASGFLLQHPAWRYFDDRLAGWNRREILNRMIFATNQRFRATMSDHATLSMVIK